MRRAWPAPKARAGYWRALLNNFDIDFVGEGTVNQGKVEGQFSVLGIGIGAAASGSHYDAGINIDNLDPSMTVTGYSEYYSGDFGPVGVEYARVKEHSIEDGFSPESEVIQTTRVLMFYQEENLTTGEERNYAFLGIDGGFSAFVLGFNFRLGVEISLNSESPTTEAVSQATASSSLGQNQLSSWG